MTIGTKNAPLLSPGLTSLELFHGLALTHVRLCFSTFLRRVQLWMRLADSLKFVFPRHSLYICPYIIHHSYSVICMYDHDININIRFCTAGRGMFYHHVTHWQRVLIKVSIANSRYLRETYTYWLDIWTLGFWCFFLNIDLLSSFTMCTVRINIRW